MTGKGCQFLPAKFSAWYKISEPEPGETVPIKVKNGPFSRLFEPIMKIYSFPDYWELDPTPFFAPFFMIFVGLCLGDLGYGLILTAAGLIGTFLAPKKVRPLTLLITVLGLSTATAGILLNGFFGHTIFGGEGIAEGSAYFSRGVNTFSPLSPIETDHGHISDVLCVCNRNSSALFGMMLNAINSAIQEGLRVLYSRASLGDTSYRFDDCGACTISGDASAGYWTAQDRKSACCTLRDFRKCSSSSLWRFSCCLITCR